MRLICVAVLFGVFGVIEGKCGSRERGCECRDGLVQCNERGLSKVPVFDIGVKGRIVTLELKYNRIYVVRKKELNGFNPDATIDLRFQLHGLCVTLNGGNPYPSTMTVRGICPEQVSVFSVFSLSPSCTI